MFLEPKVEELYEETKAYVGKISDDKYLEYFKKNVKKYIRILNRLLNLNLEDDKELCEAICDVYSVLCSEKDYLKMLELKYGHKFSRIININTNMYYINNKNDSKKSNGIVDYYYSVSYIVAVSEEYYNDHIYTKDEIKKLINNGSIVILSERSRFIDSNVNGMEIYESIPFQHLNTRFGNINTDFYLKESAILLREHVSKERIIADIIGFFYYLEEDLDAILKHDKDISNTLRYKLRTWYDNSSEKEEISSMQKILK